MTDSIRTVAPFLAPEIISRILDSYLPESLNEKRDETTQRSLTTSLKNLSLVSSDWLNETRRRIFSHVYLTSTHSLNKFSEVIIHTLGEIILELHFKMTGIMRYKYFYILRFTPNLRFLTIPSLLGLDFGFGMIDLSNLTTLILNGDSTTPLALENLETLMAASPNLLSLTINGTARSIKSNPLSPDSRAWSKFPSNLKNLHVKYSAATVMTGSLIPVRNLTSLKHLEVNSQLSNNYESFFKLIGSNLTSIDCPISGLKTFLKYLTGLKQLRVNNQFISRPSTSFISNFLSNLPGSLKILEIQRFYGVNELLAGYSSLTPSQKHLNLELLKLDRIQLLGSDEITLNLAHLPRTRSLQFTDYTYRGNHLEESLNQLKIEAVKFEKLIVSKGSFDNVNIKIRCESLGIQLEQGGKF